MWSMLLAASSFAGDLSVDAKVPVEVTLAGEPVVQLFRPGVANVPLPTGKTHIVVLVDGAPNEVDVDVPEQGYAVVVVGKTGITTTTRPPAALATATRAVEFRSKSPLLVLVDDVRHPMASGDAWSVDLSGGAHRLALRDPSGTVIWAKGTLDVAGGEGPIVVQIAEGRLPEVANGGSWRSDIAH